MPDNLKVIQNVLLAEVEISGLAKLEGDAVMKIRVLTRVSKLLTEAHQLVQKTKLKATPLLAFNCVAYRMAAEGESAFYQYNVRSDA